MMKDYRGDSCACDWFRLQRRHYAHLIQECKHPRRQPGTFAQSRSFYRRPSTCRSHHRLSLASGAYGEPPLDRAASPRHRLASASITLEATCVSYKRRKGSPQGPTLRSRPKFSLPSGLARPPYVTSSCSHESVPHLHLHLNM